MADICQPMSPSVKVSGPRMVWALAGSVNQPVFNVSGVGTKVDGMGGISAA